MTKDDKHLWVVEFYADWCGHCKQFKSDFEKAAAKLDGIVKFGALNADVHKKTGKAQGVNGYPTIKLYVPGTTTANPYTKKAYKPAVDYTGPRRARPVVDFATAKLPSAVVPVTDGTLAKFVANGTLPKALLFTRKTETSPLLKALSLSFGGRLLFGEASDSANEAYGISEFPTLIVLPTGSAEKIVYDGDLKPLALASFLEGHAAAVPDADAAQGDGASAVDEDTFVVNVDSSNVHSLVEAERGAWLLCFAGSEVAELPERGLNALAESLNGQVKVGKASTTLAAKFGVELGAVPVLAVYPFRKAGKARKVLSFKADESGVASAKKAALDSLPDDGVTALNTATLDRWMQESMMTTDSQAFCILFSDKPAVPPLLRALSFEFEGKIGFGMAQAGDKAVAERFNVQKAPTLLVMFPDESKKDAGGGVQLAGMQFTPQQHGKFNFANIAQFIDGFLRMRAEQLGAADKGNGGSDGAAAPKQERKPKPSEDSTPPPELSAENFEAECVEKGGLCGIAMLDGSADNAAAKERSLQMLGKLKARRANGPISFSWLDATCHVNFAAAFELGDADLPTMIFLSPSKLKWVRSVGAFDLDNLGAFGASVAAGRKSTSSLSELPALEEVDCSTVKRGAEAVMEDDGADDIMAEILEEERKAREEREADVVVPSDATPAPDKKKKSDMTKLEVLEAAVEECESMDLLCGARREKQLKAVEKQRDLEEKLAKIAKKKKKKAKKKAAS